jgi:putative tryptophan/tyrosine transport system permease protein
VNLVIGAVTMGFILALLGLGVFLSYRVYHLVDLTADGSFGIGVAVAAALLVHGVPPLAATAAAVAAGALAGAITGFLHTRFQVNPLLAGVLTSTALYSVSLFVMGSGSLSLASSPTLVTQAQRLAAHFGWPETITLLGTDVQSSSLATLALMAMLAAICALALTRFLGTDLGTAMRAAGNNPQMARAVAIDVEAMVVLGLGVSNGLIGLSGALITQYQGFANITMGVGAIVTGLANLMVGETLFGRRTIGRWITGAVLGAVAFRLLVAAAIRAGLNADALKLVTAVFVLAVLIVPQWGARLRIPRGTGAGAHG